MNRKIELTRIHAINWYGYLGDSFDVRGNLLVAGITGSGKSVIMDLIQLVLVAHQGKTRYNQSATGERSTRDLIGYRRYHDYDMLVEDIREPDSPPSSLNKHSGMFSGGENQAPYFIAILACYLRAYRRFITRRREPSLALVPIDEAFSKLSGNCIQDCFVALRHLDLQGVFSMSTGNIPYAIDHCDQVIAVHKEEKTVGRKKRIRNIAVTLTREAAYARFAGRSRRT